MVEQIGAFVLDQIVQHGVVASILALVAIDLRRSLAVCLNDNSEALKRLLALVEREFK